MIFRTSPAQLRWIGLTLYLAMACLPSTLLPETVRPPTLVVDGHTHQGLEEDGGEIRTAGLDELRARGYQVVVHALPVDRSNTADLFGRLIRETEWLRVKAQEDDRFYLFPEARGAVLSSSLSTGLGLLFSLEWLGPTFEGNASRASRLCELGIRLFGPPNEDPDGLFLTGENSDRLSSFGREVVASLNNAGVLIDLTHLSHGRKLAVIAASAVPTVISHGNSREAADLSFNLPGDLLESLAASGGQVWVSFNRNGVLEEGEDNAEGLSRLLDHFEALTERLGPENVGIGTDLQADGRYVPEPLNRLDTLERLRSGLLERGFTPGEVDGFLGGNVLRSLDSGSRKEAGGAG